MLARRAHTAESINHPRARTSADLTSTVFLDTPNRLDTGAVIQIGLRTRISGRSISTAPVRLSSAVGIWGCTVLSAGQTSHMSVRQEGQIIAGNEKERK